MGLYRKIKLYILNWLVERSAEAWALHDVRDIEGVKKDMDRYMKAVERLVHYKQGLERAGKV